MTSNKGPSRETVTTSRFLSLVLRHRPSRIGIELDAQGWVDVDTLLGALVRHGRPTTRADLDQIVATNNKKRFAYSSDGRRIRASQGHSLNIDLGYPMSDPPKLLYHGTVERSLEAIRSGGLRGMSRHAVHLSADEETAQAVGSRRGDPVILRIRAREAASAGHSFSVSANGVWLTDYVSPEFIDFPSE